MASVKSLFQVNGNLGGVNFYQQDGKTFARNPTSLSKERIMKDKAFQRTRENMMEFKGAAQAVKNLRRPIEEVFRPMSVRKTNSRLLGVCRRITNKGAGLRGKRNIEILPNAVDFTGFEFNPDEPFSAAVLTTHELTGTAARNAVTWDIPDFNAGSLIKAPRGATHFKFVLAISAVSDLVFDPASNNYAPLNPNLVGQGSIEASPEISLSGMVGNATMITAMLPAVTNLPATASLVVCTGIEFYQEVNGQFYLFASGNTMRIATVM